MTANYSRSATGMTTQLLSQFESAPVATARADMSPKDDTARGYLVPLNSKAQKRFHDLVTRIKLDPAAVPARCVNNMHIYPTQTAVQDESDDDSNDVSRYTNHIWTGFYNIRIDKKAARPQDLACVIGSGMPKLDDFGVHILLVMPKWAKSDGVRQRHARFSYSLMVDSIMLNVDDGKVVYVDGKPHTGQFSLMAETSYLEFGELKYLFRLTAPSTHEQSSREAPLDSFSSIVASSASSSSSTTQTIDDYRVGVAISGGTFGYVSRGYHKYKEQLVVIKTSVYRQGDPLLNEATILRYLTKCVKARGAEFAQHVYNLVKVVHEQGVNIGKVHLITEPCGDRDLLDLWTQQRDIQIRITAFKQTVKGLHFLHQNGVMHRDLKPTNVIVCDSRQFRVVIIDAGCATRDATSADHNVGTIGYLAPEVMALKTWEVRSKQEQRKYVPPHPTYDSKVDIFALGVTMCHVLLGMTEPWDMTNSRTYLRSYNALDEFGSAVHPEMLALLKSMVDNAASERPTTAQLLADPAWSTTTKEECD